MTKIDDALVERMVALVRGLADGSIVAAGYPEARTIAELLPDPDFAEVRRLFRSVLDTVFCNKVAGGGPTRAKIISEGDGDDYWEAQVVRLALKRGRELERLSRTGRK